MKPVFIILLLSFLVLTKCAKEYSYEKGEAYHITCTVDGTPKTAIIFAAGDHTDPGNGNLSINGVIDTSGNFSPDPFLGFELYSSNKEVIAGYYATGGRDFELYAVYLDEINHITYVAGLSLADRAKSEGVIINNPFKVTVTELKKFTVRGTFSGDFYEGGDPRGRMIKITDGDFYLKMN